MDAVERRIRGAMGRVPRATWHGDAGCCARPVCRRSSRGRVAASREHDLHDLLGLLQLGCPAGHGAAHHGP